MSESDEVAAVFHQGGPATDDVQARLARARVAAALFGAKQPVRIGRYELERQLGAGGGGVVFVAHDPELSRKVALKLLAARGARDRLLSEGHALARLAHPNVVPIFDLGTHDDQVFLVMELVEGGTLRTWLEDAPRTVRTVVRAYRDAGAGLAAAHRAGFVHRDFKPDNALIGTDQRVRVVDFGLVHVDGQTRAGLGTPRYMPPEQADGGEVTPAADQYAFCASLREAIGARKDEHGTRANTVPGWLDAILARGLARKPAERYPSMDELLDALARDPATKWRRRGIVAAVLALGASAFAIGRVQSDDLPACDGGRDQLAAIWNPQLRTAVAAKLDALGTPYARQVRPQLVGALDGYAEAWSAGHLDACQAHRRGAQSDALLDRRMRCLDAARAAFGAAINVVGYARADQIAQAVVATSKLPALSRCADASLLDDKVAPPSPDQATEVAAIERELAAREVEVVAGRTDIAGKIDALIARARAVRYPPILAKSLRLRGVTAIDNNRRADAVPPLSEATDLAFAAGDDALGIEVLARRVWAQGTRPHENAGLALGNIDAIEAIAKRLPPGDQAARALLANNIGGVELALGERDAARASFQRAHEEHVDVTGPAAVELAQIPVNYALAVDDPVHRDALFAVAIVRLTALVGQSHPVTLRVRAVATSWSGDDAAAGAALRATCMDLVNLHGERGEQIAKCAFDLGWFAIQRGDANAARRWFAEVVNAEARGASIELVDLARGHLLRLDGKPAVAAAYFASRRAALADIREPWWRQIPVVESELALALSQQEAGDRTARTTLQRVHARLVALNGYSIPAMFRQFLPVTTHPIPATFRRYLELADRMLTSRSDSP